MEETSSEVKMIEKMNDATYTMRRNALKGQVFYENLLAETLYQQTYFPQHATESFADYERRPKIAIPITPSTINRLVSLLYNKFSVAFEDSKQEALWQEAIDSIDWATFKRNLLAYTLAGGNLLVELETKITTSRYTVKQQKVISPRVWLGQYIYVKDENTVGYEFIEDKGMSWPVPFRGDADKKKLVQVELSPFLITKRFSEFSVPNEEIVTGLDFIPAVIFRSVDRPPQSMYSLPFTERFDDLVVEYNQIYSQASKSVKILQNVWKTNLNMDPMENPIRITPEKINYLGDEGMLEQVVRQLNLTPEWESLERLESHIEKASEIPGFLSGLNNIGKVPSGIALEIALEPLNHLMGKVREIFQPKIEELVWKVVRAQQNIRGLNPKDPIFEVTMTKSFSPAEVEKELQKISLAEDRGWITKDEGKSLARPHFGLE